MSYDTIKILSGTQERNHPSNIQPAVLIWSLIFGYLLFKYALSFSHYSLLAVLIDLMFSRIKRVKALLQGLCLIIVPCWWDGTIGSLIGGINFQRPDLFSGFHSVPMPLNPPLDFFLSAEIPNVGELMIASFPVDFQFIDCISTNKWWIGEKYDGVRACWNSSSRTVYTRTGRTLLLLPDMMRHLPPRTFSDAELWFGRGQFSSVHVLVTAATELVQWHAFRMVVFDEPSKNLRFRKYEGRYRRLLLSIAPDNPFVIVATRMLCRNSTNLSLIVQKIIDEEAEGVILQRVGSLYVNGRSPLLVKLKSSNMDKEAIVVNVIQEQDGKSVELKLPNGKTFSVPPYDMLIPTPQIGDIVSFTFENNARVDIPVHPRVFRRREDVDWEEVVQSSLAERKFLNEYSQVGKFTIQPVNHWNIKNIRIFLESFAKNRRLDPLQATTWYNIKSDEIRKAKNGRAVLDKFKGGYFHMLRHIFKEIQFDERVFRRMWWDDITNRRRFFEKYADASGFDPLKPENWTHTRREGVMRQKGADKVLWYHGGNVAEALLALFPDVGLEKSKFHERPPVWHSVNHRRVFFEDYAAVNQFDPLNAENWHRQPIQKIMSTKGASVLILYHQRSIPQALLDLFPSIGIDKAKFRDPNSIAWWFDWNHRREFFESYAREHSLDPLKPGSWYSQRREKIMELPGASEIMSYHNYSVAQALTDLFPDVEIVKSKFRTPPTWQDVESRRRFFEDYARENNFDPTNPEDWYSHAQSLMSRSGINSILFYHTNRLSRALQDLFPNIGLQKSKFQEKKYKKLL